MKTILVLLIFIPLFGLVASIVRKPQRRRRVIAWSVLFLISLIGFAALERPTQVEQRQSVRSEGNGLPGVSVFFKNLGESRTRIVSELQRAGFNLNSMTFEKMVEGPTAGALYRSYSNLKMIEGDSTEQVEQRQSVSPFGVYMGMWFMNGSGWRFLPPTRSADEIMSRLRALGFEVKQNNYSTTPNNSYAVWRGPMHATILFSRTFVEYQPNTPGPGVRADLREWVEPFLLLFAAMEPNQEVPPEVYHYMLVPPPPPKAGDNVTRWFKWGDYEAKVEFTFRYDGASTSEGRLFNVMIARVTPASAPVLGPGHSRDSVVAVPPSEPSPTGYSPEYKVDFAKAEPGWYQWYPYWRYYIPDKHANLELEGPADSLRSAIIYNADFALVSALARVCASDLQEERLTESVKRFLSETTHSTDLRLRWGQCGVELVYLDPHSLRVILTRPPK